MSRELPHSNEAEQAILGGMMIYPNVTGVVFDQNLQEKDFYLDIHQRIFSAMMDICDSGKPVDVTTLIARLQDKEQLNLVGGADYIIKLSDTAISPANSMSYIEIIKSKAHVRRLIETAQEIVEEGFDGASSLDEIMDKAERDILNVTRDRKATEFRSSRQVVSTVMQELVKLRNSDTRITGIKTGYTDLDNMTNGFHEAI